MLYLKIIAIYVIALFCDCATSYKVQISSFNYLLIDDFNINPESFIIAFPLMPIVSCIIVLILLLQPLSHGEKIDYSSHALWKCLLAGIFMGLQSTLLTTMIVHCPLIVFKYIENVIIFFFTK
jgi:hypothetical protein